MKTSRIIPVILFLIFFVAETRAQELVELKKEKSNVLIIKYMFNVGSMMDPEGKEGLTRLTASLVTGGGSTSYSKSEIDDLLYPMAGEYSSFVDKEVSVFTFEVHHKFARNFYSIIRTMLLDPAFEEKDFDRLKSNQLNYVNQIIKASSDEEYSKMALEDLLFRGTRYQHMVAGTSSGLENITLQDVRDHFERFFTLDNLMIGLAGNYDENLKSEILKDAENLPGLESTLPEAPEIDMPDGFHIEIIEKEDALGSAIYGGYPLYINRADDQFAALMVANSYLGEHRKSYGQLYQKLRSARSMNYGDYTYIEWYEKGGSYQLPLPHVPRHSNYFSLWIRPVQIADQLKAQYPELEGIAVGHAHFALRLAIREIDMLVENGMTQDDFELTRQFLRSYIKLYIQTPSRELGYLMDSRFYGRENYIEELDRLLAELTLEDVNRAIRKHLQAENMYVSIITDDSEAGPLAESLRENLPSPMTYSNLVREGLPASITREDEMVENYRLNIESVKIIDSETLFK